MRAQAAALYREHAEIEKGFKKKMEASSEEAAALREERDALEVRARRLEEVLAVEDKAVDDPAALPRCTPRQSSGLSTCSQRSLPRF